MLCKKPFMAGAVPFGCGQCLPCRINRRRQWQVRQVLESYCHEENCFVTLTYSDECLPAGGCLVPRDMQLWLKRIRKRVYPRKVRFFGVGEYGPETGRAHYHLSLFGVSRFSVVSNVYFEQTAFDSWGKGFTSVGDFTAETAGYVAGYVVKKLVDRNKAFGVPEFARMSNRPGIGANAAAVIAKQLLSNYLDWESGDVTPQIRINGRKVGLGRYLLARLRQEVGFSQEYLDELRASKTMEKSLELLGVFNASTSYLTIRSAYQDQVKGKIAQIEARDKIRAQRRTL